MSQKHALIAELQMEASATRKMLERVPTDKNDWKPHEKSMKMGLLAIHVAELPSWINFVMAGDEFDLATMKKSMIPETTEELLAQLDKSVNGAIAALEVATDEDFARMWTLRNGGHVIFSMPKAAVLRSTVYSHHYHHRGQLSVYLRLLNIPVPGMYGPSSDDMAAIAAAQSN